MKIYRQGDILLIKLDKKPDLKETQKLNSKVIVGLGEATGHKHQIKEHAVFHAPSQKDVEFFAISGGSDVPIFIEITNNTELLHEEHSKISLSPGWYKPIRQREYEPERIKYVSD